MDVTLAPGSDDTVLAHHPDCPDVAALRAAGELLMTLYDVLPDAMAATCPRHSCLPHLEGKKLC